jgi:hypothetical protein
MRHQSAVIRKTQLLLGLLGFWTFFLLHFSKLSTSRGCSHADSVGISAQSLLRHRNIILYLLLHWQIRVQAIRGLPQLCKDTPEHLPKIADVLGQLLLAGVILTFWWPGSAYFWRQIRLRKYINRIQFCYIYSFFWSGVPEESLERDAASKALMSLLRQDAKGI